MRVTWARILAVIIITAAALTAAAPVPAHAVTTYDQLCDDGNSNGIYECLNAWNGGPHVRDYTPAVLNDAYGLQGVNRCGNGNLSTQNCPVSGIPAGYPIYQIVDERTGRCIGDQAHNDSGAYEVACNQTSYPGTGGGEATIFIAASGCRYAGFFILISNYWTGQTGGWNHVNPGLHFPGITNGEGVFLNSSPEICLNETQFQA